MDPPVLKGSRRHSQLTLPTLKADQATCPLAFLKNHQVSRFWWDHLPSALPLRCGEGKLGTTAWGGDRKRGTWEYLAMPTVEQDNTEPSIKGYVIKQSNSIVPGPQRACNFRGCLGSQCFEWGLGRFCPDLCGHIPCFIHSQPSKEQKTQGDPWQQRWGLPSPICQRMCWSGRYDPGGPTWGSNTLGRPQGPHNQRDLNLRDFQSF